MASQIVRMVLKLDDKASPELRKVGEESSATSAKFTTAVKTAGMLAAGFAALGTAAIAAHKGLVEIGRSVANLSNQFGDASVITGLSAETLETFDFMARATNSSLGKIERGFAKFHQGINEAKRGTGQMVDTLEILNETTGFNIEAYDNTEDALFAYLGALKATGDEAIKAEGMVAAFGRGSMDLQKALSTGEFENFSGTLDEIGRVTGPEAIKAAQEMQRAIALSDVAMRRMKLAVFETFMGDTGFITALSVSYGALIALGASLRQLSNFIVGTAEHLFDLVILITKLPEAATGSSEGLHKLEKAFEDVQASADKATWDGVVPFLGGGWINEGVAAARQFDEELTNIGTTAKTAFVDAQALSDALALAGEDGAAGIAGAASAVSGLNSKLRTGSLFAREYSKMMQFLGESLEELDSREKQRDERREKARREEEEFWAIAKRAAAEARRQTEEARLANERYHASIAALAIEMSSLQGAYDGLFPADAKTRADQFQDSFAALGLSMAEPVSRLEEMQSLLSSLESGAFSVEVLGGLTDLQAQEFAAKLRGAIKAELEKGEGIKVKIDQESRADLIGEISGALTATAGGDIAGAAQGIGMALGASPVFGAIVGGIGAIAEIGTMTVKEMKKNARNFVKNLEKGLQVVVKALPDIIEMLIKTLPIVLVEAAFRWIPMLIVELPGAIVAGLVGLFQTLWENMKEFARLIGTREGRAELRGDDESGLLSAIRLAFEDPADRMRSFASGTPMVRKSGIAMVHRGEAIIPAGGRAAQTVRAPGSGLTVNISAAILDEDVIPRLVREIDRVTGQFGRTSAAFAGG